MGAIPADVETDAGPPMTLPLRHFLVGLVALLAGVALGLATALGSVGGFGGVAHVHLLLVGWVCLTIMGAMTQFVPVWSGTALHSRRLATAQLWLAAAGLAGLVGSLLAAALAWLPLFGGLLLAGIWTFVYNVARTLPRSMDVTERHFAAALGFFLLVTLFGLALAVGYTRPVFGGAVARTDAVAAHATLAVFGAVLTTVLGALYQLATMFTQTELSQGERLLQRAETVGYPAGVLALAAGRLFDLQALARAGGLLVAAGLAAVAAIVAHKLLETRVEWTPMLSRYAVFAGATLLWAALAARAWLARPATPETVYGAPGSVHLLALGAVGFVVWGTLYHVVPFIVWVGRYSDRLGFEAAPMIDDLYRTNLARADLACLLAGTAALTVDGLFAPPLPLAPVGGAAVLVGGALFAANLLLVVREHSPYSVAGVLAAAQADRSGESADRDPAGPAER